MRVLRSRKSRFGLLFLLTVVTMFYIRTQWVREVRVAAQRSIPPEGIVPAIDTGGKVPGDPANAVEDMLKIRTMMDVYKSRHGRMPRRTGEVFTDALDNFQSYGFSSSEEASVVFTNPDARYADFDVARKNPKYYLAYVIDEHRPDGTKVGDNKVPGTRDILLFTDLYFHENVRHYKNTRSSENPVGFYMVMWDDGKIEQIPYDKRLMVPLPAQGTRRTWKLGFRGQAGVPANAEDYDKHYKQLGWKKAPRGVVGGKGFTFDSRRP